ncbi:MAG TPA: Uma2 family endonuclease [Planctomycetota bacterium]|nr:Uma2 family endonuclease [Planctomycetota bacterium]
MIESTSTTASISAPPHRSEIEYPFSDGKPVAETDIHFDAIAALNALLKRFFKGRDDVYVASNNLIYYTEGDIGDRFSPDVYVVLGVKNYLRRTYLIWAEKKPPTVVFEFTSRGTSGEDRGSKKELCASLGVKEYFLFDPEHDYLKPAFQGYELFRGVYRPIRADKDGMLTSRSLGLKFRDDGRYLAAFDAATGKQILRMDDALDEAEERASNAEAEAERLRREIERLKGRKN